MKSIATGFIFIVIFQSMLLAQSTVGDSIQNIVEINEVTINANRIPLSLNRNTGSVSLITPQMLSVMPKSIGAEEALRLVPGVRIDNQHNGERVHISIRGQGILTERGLRGIGVLVDDIPINDPSGFAPDLYDIDWAMVSKIEVLRGPTASLYGGSSNGGVLNIYTTDGKEKSFSGGLSQVIGSNGFKKTLLQTTGNRIYMNYFIGFSHSEGNGYRDHQAFRSNKLYKKIVFKPLQKFAITQVISYIGYFHQNPEGLNLSQFDNLKQANPDARPFNEYQKTTRITIGAHGKYLFNEMNDVEFTSYIRFGKYKETSNKCAEYRSIDNPGGNIQYNLHFNTGKILNSVSIGTELKYQDIEIHKLESGSDPLRVESTDETNIETDSLMANQVISQQNTGIYVLYDLEFNKFNLLASLRYDNTSNKLVNKLPGVVPSTTTKDFIKTSARIGASYSFSRKLTLFANWSQGFIPPSTEELASNPTGYSGFNTHLQCATSVSYEFGLRGYIGNHFNYELSGFLMDTENDFFRFKQSGRGNQEVFYGNAGNSSRLGIETFISYQILPNVKLQTSYTFADYKYTSATIDPVYTDAAYVLTLPPAGGQYLPNSPQHQLYSEVTWLVNKNIEIGVSTEYQSKWAIYTDANAYSGKLDPLVYQNWQKGFNLYHARITYHYKILGIDSECSMFARNLTGATYMAFTEPDPDGNSYQPGPSREFFGSIKFNF